jgi:hypothetical protein
LLNMQDMLHILGRLDILLLLPLSGGERQSYLMGGTPRLAGNW